MDKLVQNLINESKEEYNQDSNQSSVYSINNNCNCPTCDRDDLYRHWIQCNECRTWYHSICANIYDSSEIDEFHCKDCEEECGPSKFKKITNSHRHDRTEADALDKPMQNGTPEFIKRLKEMKFQKPKTDDDYILKENGEKITLDYFIRNGFRKPILMKKPSGLQMVIPDDFKIEDLIEQLGETYEVEIINVYSQKVDHYTLKEFIELLNISKIPFNSISLELSKTNLPISPPKVVRDISWAEEAFKTKDVKDLRPAVEKYCLISMKDSYTDFHIDFSGTSVWYHVVKGKKTFYFIKPTEENIAEYRDAEKDESGELFLVDRIGIENVFEITLEQGNTLLLPTGYIHGVYTPEDSLVFGGNFLHSFSADLQIKIFHLEESLDTSDKFKFPSFKLTHYLAVRRVYGLLKDLVKKQILTKETCSSNQINRQLLKSFKEYHKFTYDYFKNLKKAIESKRPAASDAEEKNPEEKEEEHDYQICTSNSHQITFTKMKICLDNLEVGENGRTIASGKDEQSLDENFKIKLPRNGNYERIEPVMKRLKVNNETKIDSDRNAVSVQRNGCKSIKKHNANETNDNLSAKISNKISNSKDKKKSYRNSKSQSTLASYKNGEHLGVNYRHHYSGFKLNSLNSSSKKPEKLPNDLAINLNNLNNVSLANFRIPKKQPSSNSQQLSTEIDQNKLTEDVKQQQQDTNGDKLVTNCVTASSIGDDWDDND